MDEDVKPDVRVATESEIACHREALRVAIELSGQCARDETWQGASKWLCVCGMRITEAIRIDPLVAVWCIDCKHYCTWHC